MKMELMGYPEMLGRNYHYSLCNSPGERSCSLYRSGRLKSSGEEKFSASSCYFLQKKEVFKFSSITGNNLDVIGKRNLAGGAGNVFLGPPSTSEMLH
jgi:hypothetical protein